MKVRLYGTDLRSVMTSWRVPSPLGRRASASRTSAVKVACRGRAGTSSAVPAQPDDTHARAHGPTTDRYLRTADHRSLASTLTLLYTYLS